MFFTVMILPLFALSFISTMLLMFNLCAKRKKSHRITRLRPIVTNRPKMATQNMATKGPASVNQQSKQQQGANTAQAATPSKDSGASKSKTEARTAMNPLVDVDPYEDIRAPRSFEPDAKAKRIKEENLMKDPKDNNPYPTIEQVLSDRDKD